MGHPIRCAFGTSKSDPLQPTSILSPTAPTLRPGSPWRRLGANRARSSSGCRPANARGVDPVGPLPTLAVPKKKNRKTPTTPARQVLEPQPVEDEVKTDPARHDRIKIRAETFSGPLPHPDILARYEEVHPGLANRIVHQAESETAHRQEMERAASRRADRGKDLDERVVKAQFRGQTLGTILGAGAFLALLVCGTFLLADGKDLAGLTALTAAAATIFISWTQSGRRRQKTAEPRSERLETNTGKKSTTRG